MTAEAPTVRAGSAALAAFFREVSPRLLEDVRASGVLAPTPAADNDAVREAFVAREWLAVSLHAVIRGVVASGYEPERAADIVDALHDTLLPQLADSTEAQAMRKLLAARYGGYDGITRTLGQDGAAHVPGAIAEAFAKHLRSASPAIIGETVAPLLEAMAEGATQALADVPSPHWSYRRSSRCVSSPHGSMPPASSGPWVAADCSRHSASWTASTTGTCRSRAAPNHCSSCSPPCRTRFMAMAAAMPTGS